MEQIERFHPAFSAFIHVLLVGGLAAAYLSVAAGVLGFMDAGTVAFTSLCGAATALGAIVVYLATADAKRRRRLRTG
jgi:hypothetical protein